MKEFKTTDLSFAAYLRLQSLPLVRIERVPNTHSRFQFIFNDVDDLLNQIEQRFLSGELSVEPNAFHNTIKQLSILVKRAVE